MKKDITSREDIVHLVNTFYDRVQHNTDIGPIFNDVAKVDWNKHLPKMYDFWESILFGVAKFKGNPMEAHFHVHQKQQLRQEEFNVWKDIFFETVDELFEGETADLAKQKATSIADLMHFKLNYKVQGINIRTPNK